MSIYKSLTVAFCSSILVVTAHAGGGFTGGSTEITQLMNNGELMANVSQTTKVAITQVNSYIKQIQQYAEQLRSGQQLIGRITGLPVAEFSRELQRAQELSRMLQSVNGSTAQLRQVFDSRRVEALQRGLTMTQYVERENERIESGDQRARQRLEREEKLMQEIQKDYEYTKEVGEQISGTVGIHQSMQQLNLQMNKLIQQNARMMELTSNALNSDKAQQERDRMVKEQRALTDNQEIGDARDQYIRRLLQQSQSASQRR